MKIIEPDYYSDFQCAADRCPDTCCTAWEVILDPETLQTYRTLPGRFGQAVRRSIYFHDGAWMLRTQQGRCPLLTKHRLCSVQLRYGQQFLCKTCREYPKFVSEYGLLQERGLSLSCPEVCRTLLSRQTPVRFVAYENDQPLTGLHDLDAAVFSYLREARGHALALAQNRAIPIRQRVASILIYAKRLQQQIDTGKLAPVPLLPSFTTYPGRPAAVRRTLQKWLHAMLRLEILSVPHWKARLESYQHYLRCGGSIALPPDYGTAAEQVLVYYVYKFFLRGAYHQDILLQAQLIAFFCCMLGAILFFEEQLQGAALTDGQRVELIHRFARETEHSEANLAALFCRMRHLGSFSPDALLRVLLQN